MASGIACGCVHISNYSQLFKMKVVTANNKSVVTKVFSMLNHHIYAGLEFSRKLLIYVLFYECWVFFCELCNQMRFEVDCAKSHHCVIPEPLIIVKFEKKKTVKNPLDTISKYQNIVVNY